MLSKKSKKFLKKIFMKKKIFSEKKFNSKFKKKHLKKNIKKNIKNFLKIALISLVKFSKSFDF